MRNLAITLLACLSVVFPTVACCQQLPLPEERNSTIGYKSAAEALAALRVKPGVEISTQQGWTIIKDNDAKAFWSFPPKENPAFPSAIKRTIVERDGKLFVETNVLCQATKSVCDQLVIQFNQLNNNLREQMHNKP